MRTLLLGLTLSAVLPSLALAQASPAPVAPASPAPVAAAVVHMEQSAFVPATLRVAPGQTVTFVNDDDVEHDATAADGSFASPELDRGQQFVHTFAAAGTFTYGCNDHAFMHGTIVVTAR